MRKIISLLKNKQTNISIQELKAEIHQTVENIKDENILKEVYDILKHKKDFWDEMSEDTKKAVEQGLTEADAGLGEDAFEVLEKMRNYIKF